MQYAKLENGGIIYAKKNFVTDDGTTICNFNKSPEIMLKYGYKPVIEADKPDYPYILTYEETADEIKEVITRDTEAEERAEQERKEAIRNSSMTRGDVFEALILAKGVTKAQLREMIENYEGLTDIDRALYLNRFDEALEFYRKHPAIDLVGGLLGITPEQMDRFFESKEWQELVGEVEFPEEVTEENLETEEENIE